MKIKNNDLVSYAITVVLFFIYGYFYYWISNNSDNRKIMGINLDVVLYLLGLVLFLVILFIVSKVVNRFCFIIEFSALIRTLFSLSIVVFVFFHFIREKNEFASSLGELIRYNKIGCFFSVLILIPILFIGNIVKLEIAHEGIDQIIRLSVISICSLIVFFVLFFPNFIADKSGGVVHFSAYIASIVSNMDFQPFSEVNYSIYGHYSLCYVPIVWIFRLFGANPLVAIQLAISFWGSLTTICILYITNRLIKDTYIFVLTSLSVHVPFVTYIIRGEYYQLYPHRFVVPCVFLALILLLRKYENKFIHCIVMILLFSFGFIWNLETTAVCVVAYMAYAFLGEYQTQRSFVKSGAKLLIAALSSFVGFLISYVFHNLYNTLVGGKWLGLSTFLYPFTSNSQGAGEYDVFGNIMQYPIGEITNTWFCELVVFLVVIAGVLFIGFKRVNPTMEDNTVYYFLIASVGVGLLVDYINRSAAFNAVLSYPTMVILLGVGCNRISDGVLDSETINGNKLLYDIGRIIKSVLVLCAVEMLVYSGVSLYYRSNMGGWDIDYVESLQKTVMEQVGEDTVAVGSVVPLFYHMDGNKNTIYTVDLCDILVDPAAMNYLYDSIQSYDSVITDAYFLNKAMLGDFSGDIIQSDNMDIGVEIYSK